MLVIYWAGAHTQDNGRAPTPYYGILVAVFLLFLRAPLAFLPFRAPRPSPPPTSRLRSRAAVASARCRSRTLRFFACTSRSVYSL